MLLEVLPEVLPEVLRHHNIKADKGPGDKATQDTGVTSRSPESNRSDVIRHNQAITARM